MSKNKLLSVVLAVYNEGKNLDVCLSSVVGITDEIVIIDGGSQDDTVTIAEKHNALIVKTNNPPIFHINKQKAVDNASGDWILQLDADEIVSDELKRELLIIINDNKQVNNGYYIARKNYFLNQWMKKGGMYPDYVIRLFKRGKGKFPCKSVHEQIEIDGEVGYLKYPLIHKPYPTFEEYMRKADTYTSLTRDELLNKNLPINVLTILEYLFIKPVRTFVNLYFRHRGILDGFLGFVWAFFSGLHFAWAYLKYIRKRND